MEQMLQLPYKGFILRTKYLSAKYPNKFYLPVIRVWRLQTRGGQQISSTHLGGKSYSFLSCKHSVALESKH